MVIVTETSSAMQTEEPEAHSYMVCSKKFKYSKGLQCHFLSKQQKRFSRF